MEEWAKQADKYEEIKNDGLWNKTLQLAVTIGMTHPFSAVRVREILKWGQSYQYRNLIENLRLESFGKKCSRCNRVVSTDWAYCKRCGTKL